MQYCARIKTDVAEEWPDIEFNGQSLEVVVKFCYRVDTVTARDGCCQPYFWKKKE